MAGGDRHPDHLVARDLRSRGVVGAVRRPAGRRSSRPTRTASPRWSTISGPGSARSGSARTSSRPLSIRSTSPTSPRWWRPCSPGSPHLLQPAVPALRGGVHGPRRGRVLAAGWPAAARQRADVVGALDTFVARHPQLPAGHDGVRADRGGHRRRLPLVGRGPAAAAVGAARLHHELHPQRRVHHRGDTARAAGPARGRTGAHDHRDRGLLGDQLHHPVGHPAEGHGRRRQPLADPDVPLAGLLVVRDRPDRRDPRRPADAADEGAAARRGPEHPMDVQPARRRPRAARGRRRRRRRHARSHHPRRPRIASHRPRTGRDPLPQARQRSSTSSARELGPRRRDRPRAGRRTRGDAHGIRHRRPGRPVHRGVHRSRRGPHTTGTPSSSSPRTT